MKTASPYQRAPSLATPSSVNVMVFAQSMARRHDALWPVMRPCSALSMASSALRMVVAGVNGRRP
jgi:hypothetical protein